MSDFDKAIQAVKDQFPTHALHAGDIKDADSNIKQVIIQYESKYVAYIKITLNNGNEWYEDEEEIIIVERDEDEYWH